MHHKFLVTKWRSPTLWFLPAALLLTACNFVGYKSYNGKTMGTYYRIVADCQVAPSQSQIEEVLGSVDAVMSNYREDSIVEVFNRYQVGSWFTVDESLVYVATVAHQVSELTSGAFDITVKPLVDAWGFGPPGATDKPTDENIQTLLEKVDYQGLEIRDDPPGLLKKQPLTIDLSGIAKGYGVDMLAELLDQSGCENYLAEIGGELRVKGVNQMGRAWEIGIESPLIPGLIQERISISHGALATTGDYRNYLDYEGVIYPHVLDAKSGSPVEHMGASVTVHMRTATEADSYATALYALGEAGLQLAEENDIAALFQHLDGRTGRLEQRATSKMKKILDD
ncbi:MAG: FAD:protein FMN transferase [Gammaproteobacteria bacterium]|nr:FAD:protein FMN transferase [Gammaproteobacteria bacterium]